MRVVIDRTRANAPVPGLCALVSAIGRRVGMRLNRPRRVEVAVDVNYRVYLIAFHGSAISLRRRRVEMAILRSLTVSRTASSIMGCRAVLPADDDIEPDMPLAPPSYPALEVC